MNTYILIFKFFLVAHNPAMIGHFTARVLGPVPMNEESLTLMKRLESKLGPNGFVVRAAPPDLPSSADAAEEGAGLYQMWLRYGNDEGAHLNEPLPEFHCETTKTRHEYGLPEVFMICHH